MCAYDSRGSPERQLHPPSPEAQLLGRSVIWAVAPRRSAHYLWHADFLANLSSLSSHCACALAMSRCYLSQAQSIPTIPATAPHYPNSSAQLHCSPGSLHCDPVTLQRARSMRTSRQARHLVSRSQLAPTGAG